MKNVSPLQSNILVDDKYKAVIADFGLSLFVHGHSRNYASHRTGNSGWTAPELLEVEDELSRRPTPASDVYAFSIVCVEVSRDLDMYCHRRLN